jgi:redox-regulated HSP33 family molecular chaperone
MIGAEEARAVLEEEGRVHVTCEFCGESYSFDRTATERALADNASGTPPAAG